MAELLGGDAAAGFIGFDVPHGVGGEFQVVMKQLGKRDATTKLKVRCYVHAYNMLASQSPLCQKSGHNF